jgi:16S rRNA (guanine527-N7)-methyltransferase
MMRWNRSVNLTAITDPLEIAAKHFIDSLSVVSELRQGAALIDIGSGAGFPGLPLKILMPSLHLTLLDASRKKTNFLKQAIRLLSLDNIEVHHARAEDLANRPAFCGTYDVAVSRAFSSLRHFIRIAAPLIRPGGKLIAMKGKNVEAELLALKAGDNIRSGAGSASRVKFSTDLKSYRLPHLHHPRTLVMISLDTAL